jgi:hypothetical protein
MNETMSLLFATGILAVGATGLYMYKGTSEEEASSDEEERTGDSWFKVLLGNEDELAEKDSKPDDKHSAEDVEVEEPKSKTRANKTKRNKKSSGTKRRYY